MYYHFPYEITTLKIIQKSIDELRTMGQSTFNRFVSYVVNLIKHKDRLKDITIKDVINGLNYLRKSEQNIIDDKESNDNRSTYFYNFVPTLCWFPSCFICLTIAFTVAYAVLIILFFSILLQLLLQSCFLSTNLFQIIHEMFVMLSMMKNNWKQNY